MPKLKTHKGTKKRFRVTKNQKIKHKRAGGGHLLSGKSGKRRRNLRQIAVGAACDEKRVLKLLKLR